MIKNVIANIQCLEIINKLNKLMNVESINDNYMYLKFKMFK